MSRVHAEPVVGRDAVDMHVEQAVALAFAPVHKRAFGTAVGFAAAAILFGLTIFHVVVRPAAAPPLGLLTLYLAGYRITIAGAFVGAAWGFLVGFVAGWFVAFVRNSVVGVRAFVIRVKADLAGTRDFLDHI